jgi:integrase
MPGPSPRESEAMRHGDSRGVKRVADRRTADETNRGAPYDVLQSAIATPIRRRGPCLTRRTGQIGNVYQPAHPGKWNAQAPCYGRFWVDVPGNPERTRRTVSHGMCATKTIARQRLRDYIQREGVNTPDAFHRNTAPATTFSVQAEWWIASLPMRRRKPVKPATVHGWRHSLNKWLLPILGEVLLAEIGNAALKVVIEKMSDAGLAPQSIVTHTRVVKMVVASAVNAEGEQIYPRKWNHEFVGLPVIDPNRQYRPTLTRAEVEAIIAGIIPRYRVLVALLAGTGLRIGEALGIKTQDIGPGCRIIHIRRSVWHRQEQQPKTANAIRVVDIPEALAKVLREHVAGRNGLLFATRTGGPLSQRNVLRAFYTAGAMCGFHALRRFRTETLRRERVPEDLVRLWLGHAGTSMTDAYAKGLADDIAWRQKWANRVGLGFTFGLYGVTNVAQIKSVKVA